MNMKICIALFQVLRDILLHEGRVVRDQPDDEEELPVLPLQEVPRGGHEDRLGPARRGATQVCLNAISVLLRSYFIRTFLHVLIRRFNKLGKTTYRNSLSQQQPQQDSRQVVIKQEPVQLGRGYM